MDNEVCVIKLPGAGNYAVVSPGRIMFGLDASERELATLVSEEKAIAQAQAEETEVNKDNKIKGASISLIPTFDCNLRCLYCYARGGETQEYMRFDQAKIGLDAAGSLGDFSFLNLYLVGGGEPLLNFNMLREAVSYAESRYESVRIHLVTNGTFGDDVFDWLINHDASIRVSCDGVTHAVNRPFADGSTSSALVESNIKRLVKAGVLTMVQTIVTQGGLGTLKETVSRVADLGVEVIKIEPALPTDVSRDCTTLTPHPRLYAERLLEVITFVSLSGLNIKIDTGFFSKPSEGHYCGVAKPNMILTPHGLITACVEVARPDDPYADYLLYGKISQTDLFLDVTKAQALRALHPKNYGQCRTCNLRLICQGGCPMANIWSTGFPPRKSTVTCTIEHALLPRLLLMLATDPRVADVILDEVEIARC